MKWYSSSHTTQYLHPILSSRGTRDLRKYFHKVSPKQWGVTCEDTFFVSMTIFWIIGMESPIDRSILKSLTSNPNSV
jgi:hypothetical protein